MKGSTMREQSIAKYISLGYDMSPAYMQGWIVGYEDLDHDPKFAEDDGQQPYFDYWRGFYQGCKDG
jgi:hypothetical protein